MRTSAPDISCISGRFVLESEAGSGGMGTVYRARDLLTDRTVAVKLLQASGHTQEIERFSREADLLAELRHPGIVTYLAHGQTEEGQAYIAMEWLDGEDLARRLARGPLPLREAMVLLRRVAEALAAAHCRGVVHRDLKPSNLFLRDGEVERVVILDFGAARRADVSEVLTKTGVIIGTPSYMAPEQVRGEREVTAAADVFSLGCVLFECLTGQSPFSAERAIAVLARILFDEPPPLRRMCPQIPESIDVLLGGMLAKVATHRIANASALLAALDALHELRPSGVPAPMTSGGEQQLLSVLMAASPAGVSHMPSSPPATIANEQLAALRRELSAQGAQLEVLAGGVLMATLRHTRGAATDQAERAAQCARLIQTRCPGVAIALSTGSGLADERAPTGEVFERAAALLRDHGSTPASEQILLDDVTRGLLEVRFVLHRTPSGAYALTGEELAPDASRPLLGKPTPCVGRELELAILDSALAGCIDDAEPRAVLMTAAPGMGKSRLRHELLRRLEARGQDVLILIGRGDPMTAGSSYSLLGQALRRWCGIVDSESLEVRQHKLVQRAGEHIPFEERERVVGFIGEICGVPLPDAGNVKLRAARQDPQVMHDHITQAMLDLLRAECAERPVLLVLEDLHWGDTLTVKLVDTALRRLKTSALMVFALARPEVHDLFPRLWFEVAQVMMLRPLSTKAAQRLVQQVLGEQVPRETVGRVVEQSEGNALLLEELIRAVAEGRGDGAPDTVLAMLLARLSQLDPAARQVLRAASVFGETFPRNGVAALWGHESGTLAVDGTLAMLVRVEFIELLRQEREECYKFRHALVRDAAYSLLTEEVRIAAHRQVCSYLDQAGGTDPAVLAEHAYKGQDLASAARFYVEAAQRALASFDLEAAQRYTQRAIECGVRDGQLGIVHAVQAWSANFRLDLLTGYTHALAAIEILPPGSFWWTKAIGICFFSFFLLSRMEHADRLIATFLVSNPDPDTRAAYVEAGAILGVFFNVGGLRLASNRLVDKLTLVASDVDPHDRAQLLTTTGWRALHLEPAPFRAVQDAQRAIALFRANANQHWLAHALFLLGMAFTEIGLMAKGEDVLREARAVAIANRDAFYSTMIHLHLGYCLARQRAPAKQDEARGIAEAYRDQPQLGPAVRGVAHKILALVLLNAGDLEAAAPVIHISLQSLSSMLPYRLSIVALAVEVFLKQARPAEARKLAEEGLLLLDEQGGLGACEVPLRRAVSLARFADGDLQGGLHALRDALAQLQLRADEIEDPEMKQSYLALPENQDVLDLAQIHGQL